MTQVCVDRISFIRTGSSYRDSFERLLFSSYFWYRKKVVHVGYIDSSCSSEKVYTRSCQNTKGTSRSKMPSQLPGLYQDIFLGPFPVGRFWRLWFGWLAIRCSIRSSWNIWRWTKSCHRIIKKESFPRWNNENKTIWSRSRWFATRLR